MKKSQLFLDIFFGTPGHLRRYRRRIQTARSKIRGIGLVSWDERDARTSETSAQGRRHRTGVDGSTAGRREGSDEAERERRRPQALGAEDGAEAGRRQL
jgi:hypothetical protein